MSKFIVKTVDIVFIVLLGVVLLSMSIATAKYVNDGPMCLILGMVIFCGTFVSLFLLRNQIKNFVKTLFNCITNIPPWKLALVLGLISAITKLFFVFLFDMNTDMHEDMRMYRSFATQYANSGYITENTDYATWYKYTLMFGLILSPFAKIFGSDPKVFTSALSIFVSVAIVLLFDIIKKYTGKEIAFIGLLGYILVPYGLFQTQVLIHENMLLFFHIVAFWFYQKVFENKNNSVIRFVYLLLSGIFISLGKSINAAGQVIVISFGIYAAAKIFIDGFKVKKLLQFICIILVLTICFVGASALTDIIYENTVEKSNLKSVNMKSLPYGWGIYLGYNYETNGMWNYEDQETYYEFRNFDTQEEANTYQKELIQNRLQEYFDSPYKFFVLFFNKLENLLAIPFIGAAYYYGGPANAFFCQGANGLFFKGSLIITLLSFLYVYGILFLEKVSNFKKKVQNVKPDTHFQMVVIGVTTILLLIGEVSPKYSAHLHILIFATALFSAKSYFINSVIYRNKKAFAN